MSLVYITVEDIEAKLAATYSKIELERSTAPGTGYAEITELTLVLDDTNYEYDDTTGTTAHYYRYRFSSADNVLKSSYSNPFQVSGLSRLNIRQKTMQDYRLGRVLLASAIGTTSQLVTTDYRYKTTAYRIGRGKGQWVRIATGGKAGEASNIIATSSPTAGTIDINPALSSALAAGDQFEWHTVIDPYDFDVCINKAVDRYWFLDSIPLHGTGGNNAAVFNLNAYSWIEDSKDIVGLTYLPWSNELNEQVGEEMPWGEGGQWWKVTQDLDALKLTVSPDPAVTSTIYLKVLRRMPQLHTDSAVLPSGANPRFVCALVYDEVLHFLIHSGLGTVEDRKAWEAEKNRHSFRILHPLVKKFTPKLPPTIPQSVGAEYYPSQFFRSR